MTSSGRRQLKVVLFVRAKNGRRDDAADDAEDEEEDENEAKDTLGEWESLVCTRATSSRGSKRGPRHTSTPRQLSAIVVWRSARQT